MTENEIKWNLDGVIKYLYKKNELGGDDSEKQYQVDNSTIDLLEELQQYRAIGTVEECREARERQRWKKVEYITDMTTLGMLNGICPVCGETAHIDRGCKSDNSYCTNCGQNLDWSDTP